MTLKEIYREGENILDEAGVPSPGVDSFYLLEYATGQDRAKYLVNKDRHVQPQICANYFEMIRRRAEREPYQYITGIAEFMGYKIRVNPDVLIPRLDSEIIVEEVVKIIETMPESPRVLDMCTGSGCLAVAIAGMSGAKVTATDISPSALKIAQINAGLNGLSISFIESDLFENIDGRFDVIVSNPPYVTEEEYEELMPEVREFEPRLALVGGEDGLDFYRQIVVDAEKHLRRGGWLALEIGCSQASAVRELLSAYKNIKIVKDLAGLDRVILAQKPANNGKERECSTSYSQLRKGMRRF